MNNNEIKNEVVKLLKCNKVTEGKDCYNVYLNFPEDLIFDIKEIKIVCYFNRDFEIICDSIPLNIKQNILKFSHLSLFDFIKFVEVNLNVFLSNRIPRFLIDDDKISPDLKPNQLSKNFKFPVYNGTVLNIKHDVYKSNILVFCCETLDLGLKCLKCESINNITQDTKCNICNTMIGFTYLPTVNDEFLGFLQPKQSEFMYFNATKYQYKCYDCDLYYETPAIGITEMNIQKCYGCHKEMKFRVNSLEFYKKKDFKIVAGSELPEKGTCKHYKKLFRWFRFYCCNSLYPCDICHDELSGHKNLPANRMVCGLCSTEQSVKKECNCGMNMEKKSTGFWEGGKGNRDKTTMNRRSTRKYKM